MEVTREDFERDDFRLLGDITEAIKNAQFVAIDLEFSGVQRGSNQQGRQKTLSERYLNLKEGAEKYQVLQFGICVVHYDVKTGTFICRPYTFPVSPVTDPKWHMEREFTYQASAIQFLSDNNFDFSLLFKHGIPYLNYQEEKEVREREQRAITGVMEDIHIEDAQREFLREVVDELQAWVDNPKPEFDFVNITGPGNEINGYQKRLVHQVVRSRFPGLVTLSRSKFIQVIKRDDEQEEQHMAERRERLDRALTIGIGLRNVVDAMRESKVPVVGHNLFGDLVHLFRTFVGPLPETVEGFAAMVHADFPVVCDTKYMATCEGVVSGAASNLQTLSETLKGLKYPAIALHPNHQTGLCIHHNAGFDSLNTAKVLLKLIANYQSRLLLEESTGAHAEQKARKNMVEFINNMGHYDPEKAVPEGESEFVLPPFHSRTWAGFINRLRCNGVEPNVVILEEEGGVKLETPVR